MSSNVIEFSIIATDKFSKSFAKIGRVVAKTGATITAVSTATFLLAKKFADAEDKAAKFAKRLGQSVEELTAVQFAGERAGIAVSQINMSMQRLERRAAEAAKGMGEARGAIAELGIDAKAFTRLGLEDKMSTLARSLEGVDDAATRTRIAFKLFDSEGVAMLQMLGEGEDAFKKVTAEARKFGAVISAQAAANAEAFQDKLTNLNTVMGGIFRGFADEVIPIFSNVMERITNLILRNKDTIMEFIKATVKGFFTVLAVGERVFEGIGKTIEQLTTFKGFKEFDKNFTEAFKRIFESALLTFEAIGNFIINTFRIAFEGVKEIAAWSWENIKSVFTDAEGPSLGELLFQRLPEATESARAKLEESTDKMVDQVGTSFQIIGTSIADVLNIDFTNLDESVEQLSNSYKIFGEVVENSNSGAVNNLGSSLVRLTQMWDEFFLTQQEAALLFAESIVGTLSNAVDGIGQAFANTIVEGKSLVEGIKSVAKSVLKEVVAMLVKLGVQRLATSAIIKAANIAEAGTEAGKATGLAFANTLASVSGAPWPISLTAPAMAATHAAIASTGFASSFAAGKGLAMGLAGVAHGGLSNVPAEATYLLQQGERVLSPQQNTDLTDFLGNANTETMVIENLQIDVLPNATNADALLSMSREDMREVVADAIIPALDALRRSGIKPLESV